MRKSFVVLTLVLLSGVSLSAQEYTWKAEVMDASRTGCSTPSKNNIDETVGRIEKGKYIAPNGSVHRRSSAAAKVASVVLDAQPEMARVKDVIAYSTNAMRAHRPESELSNWLVDIVINKTEELAQEPVHMGVCNFGGVRMDMPQGDVILDDLLSMFPFKNYIVCVKHKGITIRKMLEEMASERFQIIGGVRVVVEDKKLVSVEIDGEPLDDDKIYNVATISFLLDGGDGITLRKDAVSLLEFRDVNIIDAVLEHVYAETAAGRPIEYKCDGRVIIR